MGPGAHRWEAGGPKAQSLRSVRVELHPGRAPLGKLRVCGLLRLSEQNDTRLLSHIS